MLHVGHVCFRPQYITVKVFTCSRLCLGKQLFTHKFILIGHSPLSDCCVLGLYKFSPVMIVHHTCINTTELNNKISMFTGSFQRFKVTKQPVS